jgi:hypothetical protein
MYGKVDQVPGLFHLATEFFHIQFVPLGPTRTFLMLEGPGNRGVRLALSGKSILFAYTRAAFAVIAVVGLIGGFAELTKNPTASVVYLVIAASCVPFFLLTYWLSRPTPFRAYRLAMKAGLPMGMLAEHYAKTLTPEQLEDLARRARPNEDAASPIDSKL